MTERWKNVLLGFGAAVFLILGCWFGVYQQQKMLNTLSPEDQVKFAGFQVQMRQLRAGDLLTFRDGKNYMLCMVERWEAPDRILLREGPPSHQGLFVQHVDFRGLFDSFKQVTDICKKDSDGYQELATHYWLQ